MSRPLHIEDLNILVVDDHMIIRKLVSTQLKGLGIEKVETASDGEQALTMMKDKKFDIVLLDWAMPNKSGLNVLKECRKDSGYDDTAIIMLTAASEQKSVKQALEAGATSYIVKPMSINTLQDKLDQAVQWLEGKNNAQAEGAAL